MDLKEFTHSHAPRHPWETSRLTAVRRILAPHAREGIRVLDVGCGDGFIARNLFSDLATKEITAVDIHLSDELMGELSRCGPGVEYRRELPEHGQYDLILLLDVLEHLEDDRGFLAGLAARHLAPGGTVLITVPAFQALFSRHDTFLGHYRRYTLGELVRTARGVDLGIIGSGYLFFSLLLPKLILFKLLTRGTETTEAGQWHRGRVATQLCEGALNLDNRLLLAASRLGMNIPGLTGWVLCQKPE